MTTELIDIYNNIKLDEETEEDLLYNYENEKRYLLTEYNAIKKDLSDEQRKIIYDIFEKLKILQYI